LDGHDCYLIDKPFYPNVFLIAPAHLVTILIFNKLLPSSLTVVKTNSRYISVMIKLATKVLLAFVMLTGSGYHLDLFALAIFVILKYFLGLPWFVAATVSVVRVARSQVAHVGP
jgi:hypothetical protein